MRICLCHFVECFKNIISILLIQVNVKYHYEIIKLYKNYYVIWDVVLHRFHATNIMCKESFEGKRSLMKCMTRQTVEQKARCMDRTTGRTIAFN